VSNLKNENAPIGVFDSGIGGLTVLKTLLQSFPNENFIYVGDTARLPYGNKSPQTIRRYTEETLEFLKQKGIKCAVIACNSASSQFSEANFKEIPVFNVIAPGAQAAQAQTKNKKIGVLGTRATVTSEAYSKALLSLSPDLNIYSVACPLFVPLAEEGLDEDPITNLIAFRYLNGLKNLNIDTCILGCTHYPILKKAISKVLGDEVQLIESGEALAQSIELAMNSGSIPKNQSKESRSIELFATDHNSSFDSMAARILGAHFAAATSAGCSY
jgi:glutamate racemase